MTTLRVIVDDMLAPAPGTASRYAADLTRQLIVAAPAGTFVEGVVAASTEAEYETIEAHLPGLAGLHKSSLARRELTLAWQHGFTKLPGGGMVHSPSLFAPLSNHDRLHNAGEQTVVTLHDTLPWTHPESLSSRTASWRIAMAKRAHRYADAVVVPTHAVGNRLSEFLDFGDRLRVIGGAASTRITRHPDSAQRAAALDLPQRYVLAFGGLEAVRNNDQLIRAMKNVPEDVSLVLVTSTPWDSIAEVAKDAGVAVERMRTMPGLSDTDLSVVLERALALVVASEEEGFGLPMLEAFEFGTPVIHSDAAALVEVADDAGLVVALSDREGYPGRLADAIRSVIEDPQLAERLGVFGTDRSRIFTWRGAADKVWQLHADL